MKVAATREFHDRTWYHVIAICDSSTPRVVKGPWNGMGGMVKVSDHSAATTSFTSGENSGRHQRLYAFDPVKWLTASVDASMRPAGERLRRGGFRAPYPTVALYPDVGDGKRGKLSICYLGALGDSYSFLSWSARRRGKICRKNKAVEQ